MFNYPDVAPNLDILFRKLTSDIGVFISKTPSAHYTSEVENFMQSLSYFLISLVVTCSLLP